MKLDRRGIALTFLAFALFARIALPSAALGGLVVGLIPYLVLVLASFTVRARGTIWGGGLALALADVIESVRTWLWTRALSAGATTSEDLYGASSWHLLILSPASTVFVLPVGMLIGSWIGRWRRAGESREQPVPIRTASATAANITGLLGATLVVTTTLVGGPTWWGVSSSRPGRFCRTASCFSRRA